MTEKLKEGIDFYFNDDNNIVHTEDFLKRRGRCCQSGCRHCPYHFKANPDVPIELQNPWNEEEEVEIYDGEID